MHRDHVPTVPEPLHLLGSSPVCYNQGMVKLKDGTDASSANATDVHVITVQGHPEFTSSISDLVISARASTGILPGELADDGHRRNKDLKNDGVDVIGRLFWRILDKSK
jgi:GMP synthase-like glutamine amidotransferase